LSNSIHSMTESMADIALTLNEHNFYKEQSEGIEKIPKNCAYLKTLINDKGLRKKMGLNARNRIKEEYNWESKLNFMKGLIEN
ncbi:MAG: hypothetical protein IJ883_00655, partial [Eubacterium sp.]|nr:hypothetical protein [Eubacterium sp.]